MRTETVKQHDSPLFDGNPRLIQHAVRGTENDLVIVDDNVTR